MKTAKEYIELINTAVRLDEILSIDSQTGGNLITEYRTIAKMIHPDLCKEVGTSDALAKLNTLKEAEGK